MIVSYINWLGASSSIKDMQSRLCFLNMCWRTGCLRMSSFWKSAIKSFCTRNTIVVTVANGRIIIWTNNSTIPATTNHRTIFIMIIILLLNHKVFLIVICLHFRLSFYLKKTKNEPKNSKSWNIGIIIIYYCCFIALFCLKFGKFAVEIECYNNGLHGWHTLLSFSCLLHAPPFTATFLHSGMKHFLRFAPWV